jgi:hypothetical protein
VPDTLTTMLGARLKRRSDVRVTVVVASLAAVALVAASVACGSFSGDDANAGGGGDASSADVIAADAPSSADTSTASDAATDVADTGLDSGVARHLSVFVLSMPWSIGTTYEDGGANLGGRDSADHFCADEGAAAGLGSSFQAFMSRPSMDAISRLPSDADWSLPNAAGPKDLVFASRAAIDLGQNPLHMLNRGAGGLPLADDVTAVWTGTSATGRATGVDCSDWGIFDVGTTGRTDSLGPSWANAGSTSCGEPLHVFCFGY